MTISTTDDDICVELHGREQFWALRAKVSVAKATIKDIRFEQKFQDWRKWEVRMPGMHAPTKLLAGSYWTEEGWDFLYIRRPVGFIKPRATNVLVIETDQDRYRRIILSSDEKEVSGIIKWWKKLQSQPKSKSRPKPKIRKARATPKRKST